MPVVFLGKLLMLFKLFLGITLHGVYKITVLQSSVFRTEETSFAHSFFPFICLEIRTQSTKVSGRREKITRKHEGNCHHLLDC